MKTRSFPLLRSSVAFMLLALGSLLVRSAPLGTAFTYQGRLTDGGSPATGYYDLKFSLYDASTLGALVGTPTTITLAPVGVTNGLFTVTLDFGSAAFAGSARWLEIAVRTNGSVSLHTVLSPRQPLTPAPYALFAPTAATATSVPWSALTGIPTGFTDGIDNDTTYSAGAGLTLSGAAFAIAPLGVADSMLADNAVTAPKIASSQVVKSLNTLKDDVTLSAGANIAITPIGNSLQVSANGSYWSLAGNAGTTPGAQFLGTTDLQPLELKVNGARALRLEPGGSPNLIGGYSGNVASAGVVGGTIGGGGTNGLLNRVTKDYGTVGGGAGNRTGDGIGPTSTRAYGTVAGGYQNFGSGGYSAVGGGYLNESSGTSSTIAGGSSNVGSGDNGTVAGGVNNNNNAFAGTIGGGQANTNTGIHATIAGGRRNLSSDTYASIGGGFGNSAGLNGTVAGGTNNAASGNAAFVGGGHHNLASGAAATVNGGENNTASGAISTIAGGEINTASGIESAVGGGLHNLASGSKATIAGGEDNQALGNASALGGGRQNAILTDFATIGGGRGNTNTGYAATVSGGGLNLAASDYAAVGGGSFNLAGGLYTTVGGGSQNQATGYVATVAGGSDNVAGGAYSFAAGNKARANHFGSFVWSDGSAFGGFASTADQQFLINASGGVGIGTDTPTAALDVAGSVRARGLLRSGSEAGASEGPSPAGLVLRRINSIGVGAGQVVARTDFLTLERDGTAGGFLIRYPASPGRTTIACMGMDSAGTQVNFYTTLPDPGTGGTVQIYTDIQSIVHFQCSFGRTYDAGRHLTQVTLSRYTSDTYWSGTVTSTYDQ